MGHVLWKRLAGALCTWPTARAWAGCLVIAAIFVAVAALLDKTLLLQSPARGLTGGPLAAFVATAFFIPAFFEEVVFRGLLVPREHESMPALARLFQLLAALALFVAWHPLQTMLWAPGRLELTDGGVLGTVAVFGVAATFMYAYAQSIWPPVVLHWLLVIAPVCLGPA